MTQRVWPSCSAPSSETRSSSAHAPTPLVGLIREEFSAERLAVTLDLGDAQIPDRLWSSSLEEPLVELLGRPGKDFRSRLVEVAYQVSASGESAAMPERLPLLVEILHAGSLIIDDIEDASTQRRGRPALHLLVGLPLALNAGNWLYFLPHSVLERMQLAPHIELEVRRVLDRGVLRCHYGQALDLAAKLGSLAQREVHEAVSLSTRLKTGSLLELAAELGAATAGAPTFVRRELCAFGRSYGVALQMLDDASGLYDERRAHKGHEDLLLGRPTWPWAWLSRRLDELSYSRLQHRAREVEQRDLHPEVLAGALRKELGGSPYPAIHQHLSRAFTRLQHAVQSRQLLAPLADEIERLEHAYG